ncbi:MAG: DUF2892 domain-containing protein [bacterium]
MTVERALRLTAGTVVGISLLLGIYHTEYWFLLTGFVALNLIQSAFTNACPAKYFYEVIGLESCEVKPSAESDGQQPKTA